MNAIKSSSVSSEVKYTFHGKKQAWTIFQCLDRKTKIVKMLKLS